MQTLFEFFCLCLTILINTGIVWLSCWSLNAIGVHTICGWTVSFSWALVLLFHIAIITLKGIFNK